MHPVRNGFSEEIEVRMKNDNRVLYRRLSLVALIKKIVEESDPLALKEFHDNRTIFRFRYGEKRDLHFVEFLRALCTGLLYTQLTACRGLSLSMASIGSGLRHLGSVSAPSCYSLLSSVVAPNLY